MTSHIEKAKQTYKPNQDPLTKYYEKKIEQKINDLSNKVAGKQTDSGSDKKTKIDLYKKTEPAKTHDVEEKSLYTAPKEVA